MKKNFGKFLVIKYILEAYAKFLLIFLIFFTALFGVLELTGLYAKLERVLDLKYNSPFVLGPLFAFIVLAVLCFVIGMILYLYKYKRFRSKSVFSKAFSSVLNLKQVNRIEEGE